MTFVERIGDGTRRRLSDTLYGFGFFYLLLRETVAFVRRRQIGLRVMPLQILFTGVEAVGVVATISLALGAVIVIQGLSLLPQFGQGHLIYPILIIAITRELGPLVTAIVVAARSGTAIATEIGNMVIDHQIEAYVATGISPVAFLAVPRFLGVIISTVVLNLYFNAFGLLGSFIVTQFAQPIGLQEYFSGLLGTLTISDIGASLIKSAVFGAIISTVSTFYGFKVERAQTEVPQMTIHAVGRSVVLCIIADAIITVAYYV